MKCGFLTLSKLVNQEKASFFSKTVRFMVEKSGQRIDFIVKGEKGLTDLEQNSTGKVNDFVPKRNSSTFVC